MKVQNYVKVLAKQAGQAILSWAIEGAGNFIRNNFKLDIPEAVICVNLANLTPCPPPLRRGGGTKWLIQLQKYGRKFPFAFVFYGKLSHNVPPPLLRGGGQGVRFCKKQVEMS